MFAEASSSLSSDDHFPVGMFEVIKFTYTNSRSTKQSKIHQYMKIVQSIIVFKNQEATYSDTVC